MSNNNSIQTAEMILVSLASNPAVIGKGSALGDTLDEGVMNKLVHLATYGAGQLVGLKAMSADAQIKNLPPVQPETYDGYKAAAPAEAAPAATPPAPITPVAPAPPAPPAPLTPEMVAEQTNQFGEPKPATMYQVLADRIRKLATSYEPVIDKQVGVDITAAVAENMITAEDRGQLHALYKELVSPIKDAIKKAAEAQNTSQPITN